MYGDFRCAALPIYLGDHIQGVRFGSFYHVAVEAYVMGMIVQNKDTDVLCNIKSRLDTVRAIPLLVPPTIDF